MKTLIMGHLGSIGKRYGAILTHFSYPWIGYDAQNPTRIRWDEIDKVIVATPTETHFDVAFEVMARGKDVLCEKPLSKKVSECERLEAFSNGKNAFVVCNYKYALRKFGDPPYKLQYCNYHTGKDGLWWDVCQLIYMDPMAVILDTNPYFLLEVNGREVPYKHVEYGYIHMLLDFVEGKYAKLWTFEDGRKMTERVIERIEREAAHRDTGEDLVYKAPKKDLREDWREITS